MKREAFNLPGFCCWASSAVQQLPKLWHLLASPDKSRHVLACGGGAIVVGEALLRFCAAGGLSWPLIGLSMLAIALA